MHVDRTVTQGGVLHWEKENASTGSAHTPRRPADSRTRYLFPVLEIDQRVNFFRRFLFHVIPNA